MDFDGVLTDNTVYTDSTGKESVRCSKLDSLGLDYLKKKTNITPFIVSKERNEVVLYRAKKMNIKAYIGIANKKKKIEDILKRYNCTREELCYVGNDYNDIEAMEISGFSVCVRDAASYLFKYANYITNSKGGEGAIREVIELILYSQDSHPFPEGS